MGVETTIILDVSSHRIRRLPMKKAGFVLIAGLLLMSSLPLFAQQAGTATSASTNKNPQDAYYKVVPIVKVWMHQLGYMVQFWTSKSQIGNIYIPLTWFNQGPLSKADIIYGNQPGYPYLSIVWVDGKFDHVKLYVLDNYNSLTWGVLSQATDLSAQFNVQDVPKDF
jgi:hypothetical protein